MVTFFLVRHGEVLFRRKDPPLSEVGILHAEMTGKFLEKKEIKKIFSSPSRRTMQTAEIISKFLDLGFKTDKRIKERLYYEDSGTDSFEEYIKLWRRLSMNRKEKPPKGDSSEETGKKVEAFLREVVTTSSDSNILVVTHGGAIGDFLRNNFSEKLTKKYGKRFLDRLEVYIRMCSITTVKFSKNKFILENFAETKHFKYI